LTRFSRPTRKGKAGGKTPGLAKGETPGLDGGGARGPDASKTEIAACWTRDDLPALLACAQGRPSNVLRYVAGRLYSADEQEKWRAVETLGRLVSEPDLVPRLQIVELLRRFVWALNDESGAVPFGIPEAMGEILHRCPDLRPEYLPILCSNLTDHFMAQTGPIERGVIWALGRVGPASASCRNVTTALRLIARDHPDPETRAAAVQTLAAVGPEGRQ
jgi:hypothetical protein